MTVDWDGKIRMDPSSPYAMQRLIGLKDKFDIAFAADTDHDRHGIVTKGSGLLPPNHYLSVCIHYLFSNRESWGKNVAVGKTVVSSSMIDRVSARLQRRLTKCQWASSGLSRACSPAGWALRAKKARAPHFSGATAAYGPPIKTESSLAALGGNHGASGKRSGRNLSRTHVVTWGSSLRAHRRSRHAGTKSHSRRNCRPTISTRPNLPARRSSRF